MILIVIVAIRYMSGDFIGSVSRYFEAAKAWLINYLTINNHLIVFGYNLYEHFYKSKIGIFESFIIHKAFLC